MPPHDFEYSAERITKIISTQINESNKLKDKIAKLKPEECTFASVVLPLALKETEVTTLTAPAIFMQSVSTEKAVRNAATSANKKLSVGPFGRTPASC